MILKKYKNGNYFVTLYDDGTKIRSFNNQPEPKFPESIDIKITDYCENSCNWCYTNSGIHGQHANLFELMNVLSCLPAGIEVAIGGGNPLSHPDLIPFLTYLKKIGLIANITIKDIDYYAIPSELINGIGISITNNLKKLKNTNNIVYHLIIGIHDIKIIDNKFCKILLLGYKKQGRGLLYYNELIDNNIKEWSMYLPKYFGKCIISFDNLAIEQLQAKRWFTEKEWNTFYMGDDGQFSMYIDAVNKTFAKSSTSNEFVSWNIGLLNFFQNNL